MSAEQPPPVTELRPEDRDRAADVLGRAFTDDPLWAAILPDDDTRTAKLTRMFAGLTRMVPAADGLALTAGTDAVAVWLPPGRDLGVGAVVRSGLATVWSTLALPFGDQRRMVKVHRQLARKRKEHVPDPHWYLMALGTDPDHQGAGLGSALVRAGTQQADGAGTLTYLETETQGNVRFYEHLGFEVVEEITVDGLDVPVWLMARPPASGT